MHTDSLFGLILISCSQSFVVSSRSSNLSSSSTNSGSCATKKKLVIGLSQQPDRLPSRAPDRTTYRLYNEGLPLGRCNIDNAAACNSSALRATVSETVDGGDRVLESRGGFRLPLHGRLGWEHWDHTIVETVEVRGMRMV
jgi:hypothetical protein